MKLEIELTDEQLSLIINALEVNARMMFGNQASIVTDLLVKCPDKREFEDEKLWDRAFDAFLERRDNAKCIMDAFCKVCYGEPTYKKELDPDCHRLTDMWSALRHVQWLRLEEKTDWDVRSSEPFQMSDYPMMKINIKEK